MSESIDSPDSSDSSRRSLSKVKAQALNANDTVTPSSKSKATLRDGAQSVSDSIAEPVLGYLGRFEIRVLLGQGAFGRVYRAYDPQLDRMLALKVPIFGDDENRKASRFQAEARAAAQLRHPNIVPTYDSGRIGNQYYIATQYVQGQTLGAAIKARKPAVEQAASWIQKLAGALQYAHDMGIIHRDVKPQNIMLDEQEEPQLMDFGLAKRLNEDSGMTTEGSLLGTPAYMAPEQARGDNANVGAKSDQYALGAVLYELVTGQRPFDGPPHAVLAQIMTEEARNPHVIDPKIDKDLAAIVMKAMSKSPSSRYENLTQLAADLDRWLRGEVTLARAPGLLESTIRAAKRHKHLAFFGGMIFAVITLALIVISWALVQTQAAKNQALKNLNLAGRQSELALEERDRATAAERIAKDQKKRAETERAAAVIAKEEAVRAKEEAVRAKEEAELAKEEAERAKRKTILEVSYPPLVMGSLRAFSAGNWDRAKAQLYQTAPELRNWEWHYVDNLLRVDGVSLDIWNSGASKQVLFLPDGESILVRAGDILGVFDIRTGKLSKKIDTQISQKKGTPFVSSEYTGYTGDVICCIDPTGRWCIIFSESTQALALIDLGDSRVLDRLDFSEAQKEQTGRITNSVLSMTSDFTEGTITSRSVNNGSNYSFRVVAFSKLIHTPSQFINKELVQSISSQAASSKKSSAVLQEALPFLSSNREDKFIFIAKNPSREEVAVSRRFGDLEIWNIANRSQISKVSQPSPFVEQLAFSNDGKWLACISRSLVTLHSTDWKLNPRITELRPSETIESIVASDRLFMDGTLCLAVTSQRRLYRVSPDDTDTSLVCRQVFACISVSSDGSTFAGFDRKSLSVFATRSPEKPIATFESPIGFTNSRLTRNQNARFGIVLDSIAKRIVLSHAEDSQGNTVCVDYDGKILWEYPQWNPTHARTPLVLSRAGDYLAANRRYGGDIFAMTNGRQLLSTNGRLDKVVQFMPQTLGFFCIGGDERSGYLVRIINSDSIFQQPRKDFVGHQSAITHCVFKSDETRLFTGASDGSIIVWDVASGQELIRLCESGDPIGGMAFIDTKQCLVVARQDGEVETYYGQPNPIPVIPSSRPD